MQAYSKYEAFVASLAELLLLNRDVNQVYSGLRNQILGSSGVKHQVDVSFTDRSTIPHTLVLIECKYIQQSIKLAYVKVLKATIDDISIHRADMTVKGILVSLCGAQRGAANYAAHYGIDLQVVSDGSFYRFKYADLELIASAGKAQGISMAKGIGSSLLKCKGCGTHFESDGNSTFCNACTLARNDN